MSELAKEEAEKLEAVKKYFLSNDNQKKFDEAMKECQRLKEIYSNHVKARAKYIETFKPLVDSNDEAFKQMTERKQLEERKSDLKNSYNTLQKKWDEVDDNFWSGDPEKVDVNRKIADALRMIDYPDVKRQSVKKTEYPKYNIWGKKTGVDTKIEIVNPYQEEANNINKGYSMTSSKNALKEVQGRLAIEEQKVDEAINEKAKSGEWKEGDALIEKIEKAGELESLEKDSIVGMIGDEDYAEHKYTFGNIDFGNPYSSPCAYDKSKYDQALNELNEIVSKSKSRVEDPNGPCAAKEPETVNINKTELYQLGLIQDSFIPSSDLSNKDLRNINNGKNFRVHGSSVNQSAVEKGVEKSPEQGNVYAPSKTFYLNQDYLFTDSLYSSVNPLNSKNSTKGPEIQKLILNEFQPKDFLTLSDLLGGFGNKVAEITASVANNVGGFIIAPLVTYGKNHAIDETLKGKDGWDLYNSSVFGTDKYFNDNGDFENRRRFFTSNPIETVYNMFGGGKWLNTYEIPYFGNEYLNANYSSKWSVGSAKDSLGGFAAFGSFLGMDFPARPTFKIQMSESRRKEISSSFYLVNANEQWLKRNFEFIQAIFAGTSWIHLKYCIIRSPNVYHVLCPGRFQMIYATMDCTVTYEGKLRRNKSVSRYYHDMGINSIDDDTLWPDAWKIELKIHDLTPNNFNMYANYYLHGFVPDDLVMLGQDLDLLSMAGSLGSFFRDLGKDLLAGGTSLINDAKRTLAEFQAVTTNLTDANTLSSNSNADYKFTVSDNQVNSVLTGLTEQQNKHAREEKNKK